MSRFDLFFIITDDKDLEKDELIARHILNVHTNIENSNQLLEENDNFLRNVIEIAKKINPQMTKESAKMLADCYTQMRNSDTTNGSRKAYRVTVRQLESLIRLSEARARLDFNNFITPTHVKEAMTLINKTIVDIEMPEITLEYLLPTQQPEDNVLSVKFS